ncbi:MAG: hypothetical protein ACRYE7_00175 [Janthinobacterium lividum]
MFSEIVPGIVTGENEPSADVVFDMATQVLDYEPENDVLLSDIESVVMTTPDTRDRRVDSVDVQPSWYDRDDTNVLENRGRPAEQCVLNNRDGNAQRIDVGVTSNATVPEMEIIDSDSEEYDDDDDDDSVNIIIAKHGMDDSAYHDFIDSSVDHDSALNNEIKTLVSDIVHRNINVQNNQENTVTIFAQQTPIPIPMDTVISPLLAAHVWGLERNYQKFIMRHHESFNKLIVNYMKPTSQTLNQPDFGTTVAFFSAVYENLSKTTTTITNNKNTGLQKFENNTNNNASAKFELLAEYGNGGPEEGEISENMPQWKQFTKQNLFFKDFSVIIIRNGEFIDAAIHGKYGSVTAVLKKYDPKIIYCIGNERDPIDAFINYKYQPFYSALKSRVRYITGSLFRSNSTLMFCPNNAKYCSFCRCVDTILTHYITVNINKIIPIAFSENNFNGYNKKYRHKYTSVYDRLGGKSDGYLKYQEPGIQRIVVSEHRKPDQCDNTNFRNVRGGAYPKPRMSRQNFKHSTISRLRRRDEPRYKRIVLDASQLYTRPPAARLSDMIDDAQHPTRMPYNILHSRHRMRLGPRVTADRLNRTITEKHTRKNNYNYNGY